MRPEICNLLAVKFRAILCLGILLILSSSGFSQQLNKNILSSDTIPLKAPSVSIVNGCEYGISLIEVLVDTADSTLAKTTFTLYKYIEDINLPDSLADTIRVIKSFTFKDLEENDFLIKPEKEGLYSLKAKQKTEDIFKESLHSKKIFVSYCSSVEFYNNYTKAKNKNYVPKKLFNVQVIEFSIFDRIGKTVYLHKNNNISWNGSYLNGQDCPNGIYYFHCEYIDVADNNKKKSQSGMIELKNTN